MRIILNGSILRAQQTGIGTYVSELFDALRRIDTLQLTLFDGRDIAASPKTIAYSSPKKSVSWLRNIPGAYRVRRRLEQKHFSCAVKNTSPDIYHDPTLWPLHFDGPTVMTVHDLTHINYAHTQPAARVREIERRLPSALERCARILVDSQFIANELQEHYAVSPHKIIVAPLAHNRNFEPRRETQLAGTLQRFGLRYRRYFLFVGTLEPRKNLILALRAHARLPQALREQFPLIIAGGDGWLTRDIERELAQAIARGYARKLGYLDSDDVTDILAGAKTFIFPSLYEGFGIPVLEAMASGVPVICSNSASLPEVGGDAVRYIDAHDAAALTQAMQELLENEESCRHLSAAGIERAQLFSWEKCAAITVAAYRSAIAEH